MSRGIPMNWKMVALKWGPRLAMVATALIFWRWGNMTC